MNAWKYLNDLTKDDTCLHTNTCTPLPTKYNGSLDLLQLSEQRANVVVYDQHPNQDGVTPASSFMKIVSWMVIYPPAWH